MGGGGGGERRCRGRAYLPPPPALPASAPLRRGRRLGARGGRRRRRGHRAPAAARPHLLGDPRLQLAPQLGPGQAVEVVELAQDQQRAALRVRFPGAGLELQLHVRHLPAPPGPARLGSARPVRTAPPRLRLRLRGAGTTEERAAPGGRAGHRRRARRRAGRGAGTRMRLEGPGESGTGPRPRAAAPSQPRRPRLRGSVASGSPAQRAGAPGQKKRLVPGLLCLTRVWEVRPEIRGVTVSQVIEENGGKKDTKPKKPHGNAAPVSHGTHRIGQREKYWW